MKATTLTAEAPAPAWLMVPPLEELPQITLTGEQVEWLAAMSPADRAVRLDVIAQEQHWDWFADRLWKSDRIMVAPENGWGTIVGRRFERNRQRLFARAQAAFAAYASGVV